MSALPRGGAAKGRHRDDRAASGQSKQAAHARSAKVKPLHATLARRALLRLDSMAAPDPHSTGVPRPQFPRLCPACLPRYPLQTILRQVLVMTIWKKSLAVLALGLAVTALASPSYAQRAGRDVSAARAAALHACSGFADEWGYAYRACMAEHGQAEQPEGASVN